MVEYWNVGLDKEVTHFIASLSREILPIYHYSIFLEPIIPSFHYSTIPIAERSGAKFLTQGLEMDYIAMHYHMDLALARPPRLSARPPWLKPHDPPVIAWHWLAGAGQARDGGQAWAIRLEGKTGQERFEELGWELRMWD